MGQQCEVLLIENASATSASLLGRRLRDLGFRDTLAQDPRELVQLIDHPNPRFRAALLTTGLPAERLSALIAALSQSLAAGDMTGLAVGEAPDTETLAQLREAGFSLALWRPFDDRTLRFQVNRAFIRARSDGPARGELRAPLAWRVNIRARGRRKQADLYNLSDRGAFLETPRPSMVGAAIDVEFPLPTGPTSLAASVVHTNVPGNLLRPHLPIGMGVRFVDLSPAIRDELSRIVVQRNRELLV